MSGQSHQKIIALTCIFSLSLQSHFQSNLTGIAKPSLSPWQRKSSGNNFVFLLPRGCALCCFNHQPAHPHVSINSTLAFITKALH